MFKTESTEYYINDEWTLKRPDQPSDSTSGGSGLPKDLSRQGAMVCKELQLLSASLQDHPCSVDKNVGSTVPELQLLGVGHKELREVLGHGTKTDFLKGEGDCQLLPPALFFISIIITPSPAGAGCWFIVFFQTNGQIL